MDATARQNVLLITRQLIESEGARERMVARINGNCIPIYDDYEFVLNQLQVTHAKSEQIKGNQEAVRYQHVMKDTADRIAIREGLNSQQLVCRLNQSRSHQALVEATARAENKAGKLQSSISQFSNQRNQDIKANLY